MMTAHESAQRLYDVLLEPGRPEAQTLLDAWHCQQDVRACMVSMEGPDFSQLGVVRGRVLWGLICDHPDGLMLPFLDKVAEQAQMVPHTLVDPGSLSSPSARQAFIACLREMDESVRELMARALVKRITADALEEESSYWKASMVDLVGLLDPHSQGRAMIDLVRLYERRCARTGEMDGVARQGTQLLDALVQGGLDLAAPVVELAAAGGVHANRNPSVNHPNALCALADAYRRHGAAHGGLIMAAIDLGADWRAVLRSEDTPARSREGLMQHPLVRKFLLDEAAGPTPAAGSVGLKM